MIDITRRMLELHEKYSELFILCARESTVTGAPIIRPLWWVDPENEISQSIDSEFLVGNDLLVAPILHADKTSRSIYFPPGTWRCENNGNVLGGGQWFENYPAAINELPHFTRITKEVG